MTLLTPSNLKSVRFELKGLDEYLKKVQAAGNNIEEVVKEAIPESAKPIYGDIKAWAEKHKLTGVTLKGLHMTEILQSGNYFWVDIGIDSKKFYPAWHAVFVEYGTPTQPADPGIRTAFSANKGRVKKIQRDLLSKGGVPTG